MHANTQYSTVLNAGEKVAQSTFIYTMALNILLTGPEPRLGQTICPANPKDLLEVHV